MSAGFSHRPTPVAPDKNRLWSMSGYQIFLTGGIRRPDVKPAWAWKPLNKKAKHMVVGGLQLYTNTGKPVLPEMEGEFDDVEPGSWALIGITQTKPLYAVLPYIIMCEAHPGRGDEWIDNTYIVDQIFQYEDVAAKESSTASKPLNEYLLRDIVEELPAYWPPVAKETLLNSGFRTFGLRKIDTTIYKESVDRPVVSAYNFQ